MALVSEVDLPEDVLSILTTDTNATIAAKAQRRLSNLAAARAAEGSLPSAPLALTSPRRAHRLEVEAAAVPVRAKVSVWD